MYLGLRHPWASGAPVVDAGVVAVSNLDAGSAKPKKKPRHHGAATPQRPGDPTPPPDQGGDDQPDDPGPAAIVLTAADRVLEWRGDEVALPPQNINMGGGNSEARALDDSEIGNTTNGQGGPLRECVIQGATGTDLRATITVKMLVDGTGRVTKSRISAPHYMQDKGLLNCAKKAVGGMHFPATGAPTVVTLPVTLG